MDFEGIDLIIWTNKLLFNVKAKKFLEHQKTQA